MPSNSFGDLFTVSTWGESHGESIGVVIDGCPPNIELHTSDIAKELDRRRPAKGFFASQRKERDAPKILSGVFNNLTTAMPISILIQNEDIDSTPYDKIKDLLRPSHANYSYLKKYGIFDYRGGGRASARETVARVAAGAVAKKIVASFFGIDILSYVSSIGDVDISLDKELSFEEIKELKYKSPLFCPDKIAEKEMIKLLKEVQKEGDSIGGKVKLISTPLPPGLGDPIFEKLSCLLAHALISIPAAVGFAIGKGFDSTKMKGSAYNDLFERRGEKIVTKTNNCGGLLGGISNGMELDLTIAFKPTPTIDMPQKTINLKGETKTLEIKNGRHDLCVAIRGCAVCEAMVALVLANAILKQKLLS